jgi:RNA polymerase sigma-70 factor (ECF subfamily)
MGTNLTDGDSRAPELNDPALLEAVRRGDDSALGELLTRHAPSIFRFAMKMCRNRDDAEEVAQDTLLAAVRGAKDVREAGSLTTWFYTVARSFCIKMRRRQKHAPSVLVPVDESIAETSGGSSPDDEAAAHELTTALDEALGALEEKSREVIVLRDLEGLSASEVAEVLGISVEAVKSRLHRARAAVRARLGPLVPGAEVSVTHGRSAPCGEIETTFSRYLEGEIGPDECAAMQRHVESCRSCSAVCEGLRRTVSLCHRAGTSPLSEELQQRVHSALEKALQAVPSAVKGSRRPSKG